MMLSESQERMLMVLRPEKEAEAEAIFRKWGLDFADRRPHHRRPPLPRPPPGQGRGRPADQGPRRPGAGIRPALRRAERRRRRSRETIPEPTITPTRCCEFSASPDMSSRRWVWEQYDHLIQGNTLQRPGGDAGVVRVDGTDQGARLLARRDAALLRGRSRSRAASRRSPNAGAT